MPNNVLYAEPQIAQYSQQDYTTSCQWIKSTRIHYWTPPSWFHAVNRLKASSQDLIRTGFGFANGRRNTTNPKPVSVCPMNAPLQRLQAGAAGF